MKTIYSFIALLTGAILFSSCSGNLQIEKRHYRNGWYVSHPDNHSTVNKPVSIQEPVAANSSSVKELKATTDSVLTTVTAQEENSGLVSAPLAAQLQERKTIHKTVRPAIETVPVKTKTEKSNSVAVTDDESAAKRKTTLVTIFAALAVICFMLGFVLIGMGLLPLFLLFGGLFAITAAGIYFQKREPAHGDNEKSHHENSETKTTDAVLGGVLLGIVVLIGLAVVALIALFISILLSI